MTRQKGTLAVVGFYTITGESLVIRLHWNGGGFVWNLPVAIHAARRGHTEIRPIVDVTRLAQIASMALVVLFLNQSRRPRKGRIP